jgi:hypothetical protein
MPIEHTTAIYQYVGIGAAIVCLCEFLFYFMYYSVHDQTYVSDNLERFLEFTSIVSAALAVQYVLLGCFFTKFRVKHPVVMYLGIFFVVFSYIGWIVLVADYEYPTHYVGFALFVSAGTVYWVLIIFYESLKYFENTELLLLILVAGGFCISYVAAYFAQSLYSWVLEHIAVLVLSIAFICFFYYHDPNPKVVFMKDADYAPVAATTTSV